MCYESVSFKLALLSKKLHVIITLTVIHMAGCEAKTARFWTCDKEILGKETVSLFPLILSGSPHLFY